LIIKRIFFVDFVLHGKNMSRRGGALIIASFEAKAQDQLVHVSLDWKFEILDLESWTVKCFTFLHKTRQFSRSNSSIKLPKPHGLPDKGGAQSVGQPNPP
jgi:hypothetical protein